ncbi:MAG: hypothetical protein K9L24_05005 [Spirochaetia bacterium]|nr:hypothetical protein [Spirochaetia bacterium]MCF7946928.1 hypothetical protein [Spirochaetia bacterium]MCF7953400.1 hypothetical protein [Spirochaetales bacterium]
MFTEPMLHEAVHHNYEVSFRRQQSIQRMRGKSRMKERKEILRRSSGEELDSKKAYQRILRGSPAEVRYGGLKKLIIYLKTALLPNIS